MTPESPAGGGNAADQNKMPRKGQPDNTQEKTMPKTKMPAVIEPAFEVVKQRWGTFTSVDPDGNKLVTSLSEQGCREATDFYLKAKQEGEFTEPETSYASIVEGKL